MAEENIKKVEVDKKKLMAQLFEAAHLDCNLKLKLLQNPEAVGREWNVKFDEHQLQRLKKAGALIELVNEAKLGRIWGQNKSPIFYPIYYPIYYPIGVWQKNAILDLVKDLILDIRLPGSPGPIYYPPELMKEIEAKLDKKFGLIR